MQTIEIDAALGPDEPRSLTLFFRGVRALLED
jgi:hypothetical protein